MRDAQHMVQEMAEAFARELGVAPRPEQLTRIVHRVVTAFGGERVYVPKREWSVLGGLDASGGVPEVMRRYGVSRRTAFRVVRGR